MSSQSQKRIKKYVRILKNLETDCLESRGRYSADHFLSRLYKLYVNWKKKGVDAARRKKDS